MRICVVGWYGTETLGDRAIFAGLLSLFRGSDERLDVAIGSLYPFFTERTMLEDIDFVKKCCLPTSIDVSVFPSMCPDDLKKHISSCDCLVVGGGPLMDISEMYMLEFAVAYTNRLGKRALALGVGWGPLNDAKYIACAKNVVIGAKTVFRDRESACIADKFGCGEQLCAIDPAVFACEKFMTTASDNAGDHVCINFRVPTSEYGSVIDNDKFVGLVRDVGGCGKRILLVPMHSFCVGVDDRYFLNQVCMKARMQNVEVVNNPPTLSGVMQLYHDAALCIGMRFHSILMQSCVNGRNLVLDYTDPDTGKISNFCRSFLSDQEIRERVRNVNSGAFDFDLNAVSMHLYPRSKIEEARSVYTRVIKEMV